MTRDTAPPDDPKTRRQARLNEALRANLKKRKAQVRARIDAPDTESDTDQVAATDDAGAEKPREDTSPDDGAS